LAFLAAALGLQAQTLGPDQAEAPESLFDSKVGDVGVVLEANGTWTTRLAAGWGAGFSPQGMLPGLGYPGYDNGPVFTQVPDFTLTLRLMERYYLDVNFAGTLDDRTFEAGYIGQPGEFLQWVKIGDAPFAMPTRAEQTLSEGRRGDPAIGFVFASGPTTWETAIKYQDGLREVRDFQGYVDLATSRVGPQSWITNRFFRVPGTSWSGVQILVADPAGTLGASGGYRVALSTEASFDPNTGEIDLPAMATKQFLVTWSGAGSTYTSPLLKLTATGFLDSTLGSGGYWYVLTQPGYSSPFEIRNRYPMATGTSGSILLYDDKAASPTPLSGWTVGYSPLQNWFQVGGSASAGEEAPFLDSPAPGLPGIYPTGLAGSPPQVPATIDWSFHLPATSTATSYSLGTDVVGSSIVVTRNGVPTTAFTFDAKSGSLVFAVPIYDTDLVEISYERSQTGDPATNLVLWHGGRWDLSDDQNLEWALQGQWNMSQQTSTTENLQSPGQVTLTTAWSGKADEWTWKLLATGGARLTDSTGTRMLYGQADSGSQATLDGDALRPSAAPDPFGSVLSLGQLSESTRAPEYFRDYWSTDPVTGNPTVGAYGSPGVGDQPWTPGGWVGPYYVMGDGQRTDMLAVAEAMLATGQWTGMQMFINKGKVQDLSGTTAISVTFRVAETLVDSGGTQPVQLVLEAGNLSRNFDGTGAVRSVTYLSHPALPFYNQAGGYSQNFPIPQNSAWGNDADGSGSAGLDAPLVAYNLNTVAASQIVTSSSGWQTVTVNLTAADRQKLTNATGWRLVMVAPQAGWSGPQSKTLLVGPVIFEGSTWSVVPDSSTSGSVNPVEYADASRADGHDLNVTWSSRSMWQVQGSNPLLDPFAYHTLTFQYQMLGTDATNTPKSVPLTLYLGDAQGHGVTATWYATLTSGWATARIGLDGGSFTVNGQPAPGGTVSYNPGAAGWDRMILTKGSSTGDQNGTLVLTEIEAVDAAWEAIGSTKAQATWTQAKSWPSSDVPLVSGVKLDLMTTQDGLNSNAFSWSGQSNVSGTFGPVRATAEALFLHTPLNDTAHGAYLATLPLGWTGGPSLELSDQFSDQGLRAEKVTLGLPWVGSFLASAKATGPPTTLNQEYRLGWTSGADWPAGLKASTLQSWDQSLNLTNPLNGFGQTWVDSWSWLPPPSETATYYLLQSVSGFSVAPAPVGFSLDTTLKSTQSVGSSTVWTPTGNWVVKFPFRLSPDAGWSVTPSLSREVDAVYNLEAPEDPQDSVNQTMAELSARTLAGIPFQEQFTQDSPWDSAPSTLFSGSLISTAEVDWDRSPASDWTDLALPSAGKVGYATNRGWDSGADYGTWTTTTSLAAKGVNLFGTLGSQPVFTWYRTDVWEWSLDGSWQTGTRTADNVTTLALTTRGDLVLSPVESVGLPVIYKGIWGPPVSQTVTANNGSDWTQTLTLKPVWSFRGPANLPFEVPAWVSAREYRRMFVQQISSTMDFGWPVAPQVRNLELIWKGRILLSDKSEFDVTASWGQQWQVNLYQIGLELAIDVILSF
jgi:hypothetical protein